MRVLVLQGWWSRRGLRIAQAPYLVLVIVATASALAGISYFETHASCLPERCHRALELPLITVEVTIVVSCHHGAADRACAPCAGVRPTGYRQAWSPIELRPVRLRRTHNEGILVQQGTADFLHERLHACVVQLRPRPERKCVLHVVC